MKNWWNFFGKNLRLSPAYPLPLAGTERVPLVSDAGSLITGYASANLLVNGAVNADLAAAGSVQADAAPLLQGMTIVTGADGTKGVKLPVPLPGAEVWIKGTAAAVLKIWPNSGAAINAGAADAAYSLTTGAMPIVLKAKSATQWYSFPLVAS